MKKGKKKLDTNNNEDLNELMEFSEGSNKMPEADTGLDRYMQKEIEENRQIVGGPLTPQQKRLKLLGNSKTALSVNKVPAKYNFQFENSMVAQKQSLIGLFGLNGSGSMNIDSELTKQHRLDLDISKLDNQLNSIRSELLEDPDTPGEQKHDVQTTILIAKQKHLEQKKSAAEDVYESRRKNLKAILHKEIEKKFDMPSIKAQFKTKLKFNADEMFQKAEECGKNLESVAFRYDLAEKEDVPVTIIDTGQPKSKQQKDLEALRSDEFKLR